MDDSYEVLDMYVIKDGKPLRVIKCSSNILYAQAGDWIELVSEQDKKYTLDELVRDKPEVLI